MSNMRLLVIIAFVAVGGTVLVSACGQGQDKKKGEFALVADSLGDIPMHPDAVKLDNLALAADGSIETRWTSVGNMEPGFFVEFDFPRERVIKTIVLDTSPSPNDFPRHFVVEVAGKEGDWEEAFVGTPKATKAGKTTIGFNPPRRAKRVLVSINKGTPYWWSIYETRVEYAD